MKVTTRVLHHFRNFRVPLPRFSKPYVIEQPPLPILIIFTLSLHNTLLLLQVVLISGGSDIQSYLKSQQVLGRYISLTPSPWAACGMDHRLLRYIPHGTPNGQL